MKDEIKEAIDNLNGVVKGIYRMDEAGLEIEDIKILLDHITKLQEQQNQFASTINELGKSNVNLQNRNIELVLENDRLKENNNAMQEEMARTWKKLDKVKECMKDFLCTEEYCKLDGEAIADNYMKLLSIVGGDEE